MSEYFEYLRLMLEAFFKDFGIFFKDVFASPWDKEIGRASCRERV